MAQLQAEHITKIYKMGQQDLIAVDDVSFSIEKGEFLSITGPSGCGKSTLMHILGCLDVPTRGTYLIDDIDVHTLSPDELAHIRNQKIGFVFQQFNLLPDLTAQDNVALPLLYANKKEQFARKRAQELLILLGLEDRLDHYPSQLSGGQQQRVAIARALANNPSIILADEPTGNLDSKTGEYIMDLFNTFNQEHSITIIIVTHDPVLAQKTNRMIKLLDGRVVADKRY